MSASIQSFDAVTSSPLRVLHVTSGLGVGGAEIMLYRLVQSLHGRDGQRHAVVTLTDNCSFNFASLGVPVRAIDLRRIGNPIRGLRTLREEIDQYRPDVVQAWMYHGNIAATLACPKHLPVLWGIHHSLHDLRSEKIATRLLVQAGRWFGQRRNVRKLIYVSEKSEQHHTVLGYPKDKALVIPNGFDCLHFSPNPALRASMRQALGLTNEQHVIGSFGRYHSVKDHPLLLKGFAAVAEAFPMAKLVLAGSGIDDSNSELMGLIRALKLEGRVLMLGRRSDMAALFNALDMYVLSSKSESFPNVLGEASACGVPCITTDVGDASRIVSDFGRVVPPGDLSELIAALHAMLSLPNDERIRIGLGGRQHIVDNFGLSMVADIYTKLYDDVRNRVRVN